MTLQLITVRKAEPGLSRHARKRLENNQLNSNHHTSWTCRARKGLGDRLPLFLHFTEEENKAQPGDLAAPSHADSWGVCTRHTFSLPRICPLLARTRPSVAKMPTYIILSFQIIFRSISKLLYCHMCLLRTLTYPLMNGDAVFSLKDHLLKHFA